MLYEVLGLMSVATCGASIYYCYSQGNLTPENVEKYMEMTDKAVMECGEKIAEKFNKMLNEFDDFMSREINGTNRQTQTVVEDVSYSPQSPASSDEEEEKQVSIPLITKSANHSSDEFIVLDEEDRLNVQMDVQI